MPETYKNYINGEWIESETGETYENRNPADTTDLIGYFQRSNSADAEQAIEAANAAQEEWAAVPAPERGAILREAGERLKARKDEVIEEFTREEGKTLAEATGEVQRTIDVFFYYASKARDYTGTVKASSSPDRNIYTIKEPVGVVAAITPWNFPNAISAWKIAPALATGNTVVFKPATLTPNNTRMLVEALDEAGLPTGVLNYVTGPGSEVGGVFTAHDDVDAVSFTGSSSVGMHVYEEAAKDKKRVQTEMGGKNPTIVMPSADMDRAVDAVGGGAFGVTGQACTACSRAIVHESIYEEFVDRIVDYAESLIVGSGLDDGTDIGPHVNEDELESTLDYVEVGRNEGATLETGGNRLDEGEHADGYFVEPTVFSGVDNDMRIAQEEIFGPVVGVIPVGDFEEAMAAANDVRYGLAASIVTQDHTEANRFIQDIEAGVAKVNEKTTGLELHVPFGGYKDSSSETYREQGDAAIDFYTLSKTVYDQY